MRKNYNNRLIFLFLSLITRSLYSSESKFDEMESCGSSYSYSSEDLIPQSSQARDLDVYELIKRAIERDDDKYVERHFDAVADFAQQNSRNYSMLHLAAEFGSIKVMHVLLNKKVKIGALNEFRHTPLHIACIEGNVECAKLLLYAGADLKARDEMGATPLCLAVHSGKLKCIKILLKRSPELINLANDDGMTPLHYAVDGAIPYERHLSNSEKTYKAHNAVIEYLIDKGANMHARNKVDSTPLHIAVLNASDQQISALVDRGADVGLTDSSHCSSLDLAVMYEKPATLALLLRKGRTESYYVDRALKLALRNRNVECITAFLDNILKHPKYENRVTSGWSPLHKASYLNKLECLDVLLELLPLNKQDDWGRTPLYIAVERQCSEAINKLLEKSARIDLADREGNNPLHKACEGHDVLQSRSLMKKLLKNGAIIDAKNSAGTAALHLAVKQKRKYMVTDLLEAKADIDIQDNDGKTPLYLAAEFGYLTIMEILLNGNSSSLLATRSGCTPLHAAAMFGHTHCVKLLLEEEADVDAHDSLGWTPLHFAYRNGFRQCVKILIDHKATQDIVDTFGRMAEEYGVPQKNPDS